jgi:hypothetical protein
VDSNHEAFSGATGHVEARLLATEGHRTIPGASPEEANLRYRPSVPSTIREAIYLASLFSDSSYSI